ncbi:MAG: hypothetical protein KAX65_09810, partial [Caldilineaceae bacterium]|nr:hypothetical protein [Caldilineaceae bacterium]
MIGLSSRRTRWLSRSKWTALFTAMLLAAALAGCISRNETEIEKARARTDQARYESQAAQAQALALQAQASAAAAEAQARADAQTAMAQANAQVRVVEAQEETQRETAWLSILPWLALIIILCGGAAASALLVLWFRGKSRLVMVQAQAAMMLPPPLQWPALPAQRSPAVALLPGPVARAAERTGLTPRPAAGGIWLLVDAQGEEVYRV